MKLIAQILLLVFISFLLTPPIVSFIEDDADTASFFSFSEEEKANKEIMAIFTSNDSAEALPDFQTESSLILSENLSKHDNIASTIFIPPPNLI